MTADVIHNPKFMSREADRIRVAIRKGNERKTGGKKSILSWRKPWRTRAGPGAIPRCADRTDRTVSAEHNLAKGKASFFFYRFEDGTRPRVASSKSRIRRQNRYLENGDQDEVRLH